MDERKRRHKACDACNARKVRCNGAHRCQQCEHLNLRCEYSVPAPRQITKKKNPTKQTSTSAQTAAQISPAPSQSKCGSDGTLAESSPLASEVRWQVNDIAERAFFHGLLLDFETYVLPFHPVITIPEAQKAITAMSQDGEAQAFVYSLAAVTLNLTHSIRSQDQAVSARYDIEKWLSRSLPVLPSVQRQEDMSVRRAATLQFIHVCLMGLGKHDLAFYYLRQSTTIVEVLKISDGETMAKLELAERARRERLYWTVFVHERFYAITCQRQLVLAPLNDIMLQADETIPVIITDGFRQIVRLFMHIDEDMLSKWSATFDSAQGIDPAWIIDKHHRLDAESAGSEDEIAGLSSMQQADLVITKYWLRMLIWQMAMAKCLLSSEATEQSMSLLFPVGVSGQLRSLIAQMTRGAIEVHGSGIQQKLFELTDTIASVVLTVPATSFREKYQRIEDFKFLFEFWKSLPRSDMVQEDILESKFRRLAEIDGDS